ncbi:MAG: FtsX-like permease family protein [Bacteroidetes bacterium]|nr:FtsX-like permease family protein [Bacteroidota bacterium]MBU1719632.1 FtsX-like permease family protein [Bacteroidota bacterium]
MIWAVSWRNVWRNKTRSLVVIIAIMLGLTGGMLSVGIMNGMAFQRIRIAIFTELSHLRFHNPAFVENVDIISDIPQVAGLEEYLSVQPEVEAVSSKILIMGMAATAENGTGVMLNAVDPEAEMKVSDLYSRIVDGDYIDCDKKNAAVIGEKLARKLKVKVKNKIIVTFHNGEEIIQTAFKVTGIFKSQNTSFDEMNMFVRRADVAAVSGLSPKTAHEVSVILKPGVDVDEFQTKAAAQFPDLSARTWKELQPDLGMMDEFMNMMMLIFMVIILLALAFGIINTMLMVVLERMREIGMLMAVGMNKSKVFRMIMLETVFLTVTGGLLGVLLSEILLAWMSTSGLKLTAFAAGLEDIGYNPIIYPEVEPAFYFQLAALVILTGIFASIYPARKAVRLRPAVAVRMD